MTSRVQDLLDAGEFYEAQQLYRTQYHRLLKKNQVAQAVDVLVDGAVTLLKHGQASSATDLAQLMLDAFRHAALPVDDAARGRIAKVFQAYQPTEPLRSRFVEAALKWTSKSGAGKQGDAQLHHLVGTTLMREGALAESQSHLLLGTSESAEQLAKALFDSVSAGERDYACTRTVLQYLCLQNLQDANVFYRSFTRLCFAQDPSLRVAQTSVPAVSSSDPSMQSRTIITTKVPLFNFCVLLLLLVERKSPQLYQQLRRNYQPALVKDASFDAMLDRIGSVYFDIRSAQSGGLLGNLGNLMRMLSPAAAAAGGDDDDD